MTNNLKRRVHEHKQKRISGFTEKYNVTQLMYFEASATCDWRLPAKNKLKRGGVEKRVALINRHNPHWRDLSEDWRARKLEVS